MKAATRRIHVNDYAGHPFQIELSHELSGRGHSVTHLYCDTNLTPRGNLTEDSHGPVIVPISTGASFDKYKPLKRLIAEARYGFGSSRRLLSERPDICVLSNVPVISLVMIQLAALMSRTRTVLWLQDIQAGLAAMALGGRSHPIVRVLSWLERVAIRRADHVVTISDGFADEVLSYGVTSDDTTTIENWAPVDDLPEVPRTNAWAREHDLVGRFVFLYSGTLGIKHRPESLVDLSRRLDAEAPDARVVVVSEGVGADWLRQQAEDDPSLSNLLLLPFQPFERLPEVLGSADALVVLLEPDAGRFSVPSKVLSYLCAARCVLGLVPSENAASELIASRAGAGVATDDPSVFVAAAMELIRNRGECEVYGKSARAWAEDNFNIQNIADRFERVFERSTTKGK